MRLRQIAGLFAPPLWSRYGYGMFRLWLQTFSYPPPSSERRGCCIINQRWYTCNPARPSSTDPQRSFEYIEILITTTCISIHVRVMEIYRPSILKVNKLTKSQFIHDFSEFLERLLTSSGRLLICGNFNINWLNEADNNRKNLFNILETFNLY